jgi:hypothetical protein
MKGRSIVTAAVVIFSLTVLFGITQIQVSSQTDASRGLPFQIEGAWRNQITIRDCQSGTVLMSAQGLLTFHRGGTISETAATNPALRSPGHGVWAYRGPGTFDGRFVVFTFNPDGTFAGTQQITQSITLSPDGKTFTDNAKGEFFNPAGNLVVTTCATANAVRFN